MFERLVQLGLCLAFLVLLGLIARRDATSRIIPNSLVAALAAIGLCLGALECTGLAQPLSSESPQMRTGVALLVLCLGFLSEYAWRASQGGRHGMGAGDIKLCAAAALMLGSLAVACLAVSCLLAVVVEGARGRRSFAFGPYLCATYALCLLWLVLA